MWLFFKSQNRCSIWGFPAFVLELVWKVWYWLGFQGIIKQAWVRSSVYESMGWKLGRESGLRPHYMLPAGQPFTSDYAPHQWVRALLGRHTALLTLDQAPLFSLPPFLFLSYRILGSEQRDSPSQQSSTLGFGGNSLWKYVSLHITWSPPFTMAPALGQNFQAEMQAWKCRHTEPDSTMAGWAE